MVLWKTLIATISASYILMLPPVTTKRPSTGRLSRGPVWTNVQSLRLNAQQLEASRTAAGMRKRVAVVPHASSEPAGPVSVFAMLLANDLCYDSHVLVTDFVTSRQVFAGCSDPPACMQIALQHQIDQVVWCSMEEGRLEAKILNLADRTIGAALTAIDIKANWLDDVPESRNKLRRALELTDDSDATRAARLPSRNVPALIDWLTACEQTARLASMTSQPQQVEILKAALKIVDQALEKDANFIEAYLLKASCQDALDDTTGVQDTLKVAFSRHNPPQTDDFTRLELEADYARFCLKDLDKAIEGYSKMLELDPSNLRANWGLIDIVLTGNDIDRPGKEDLAAASQWSATIVTHHPQSAIALAILAQAAQK